MSIPDFELIIGLFSFNSQTDQTGCNIPETYGITRDGILLSINIPNKTYENRCQLNLSVLGATSTFDDIGFSPLAILNLETRKSQCKSNSGAVLVRTAGGEGDNMIAINDQLYQSDTFLDGLAAGEYLIKVKDDNNCVVDTMIVIEQTKGPVIVATEVTKPDCEQLSGSVLISAEGEGNLQFSIDSVVFQDSNFFSGLLAGPVVLVVQDTNGCTAEAELQIDQAEPFRIESILVLPATCDAKNGELEIKMQGNQLDILYKLNGELQFESVFRNLSAGEYMLQITGGSSCSIDTAINITKARCSVFAPNAFSPDHDGFNDDFRLFTGDQTEVQINTYQIFDRWGNSIYRALNFPLQSQSKWWDGTFQGRPVANGTYLYQIEISDADNSKEVLQGTISVVR